MRHICVVPFFFFFFFFLLLLSIKFSEWNGLSSELKWKSFSDNHAEMFNCSPMCQYLTLNVSTQRPPAKASGFPCLFSFFYFFSCPKQSPIVRDGNDWITSSTLAKTDFISRQKKSLNLPVLIQRKPKNHQHILVMLQSIQCDFILFKIFLFVSFMCLFCYVLQE